MKKKKRSSLRSLRASRDDIRMETSGATASGYHEPSTRDIDDLLKDHTTASEPGLVNADEAVRDDAERVAEVIDPVKGEVKEALEEEAGRHSA